MPKTIAHSTAVPNRFWYSGEPSLPVWEQRMEILLGSVLRSSLTSNQV